MITTIIIIINLSFPITSYFYNGFNNILNSCINSINHQLYLQANHEWNYLFESLGWFLLIFTLWCLCEEGRDPELSKIRKEMFYNFEKDIIDLEKKIDKVHFLLNSSEIDKNDKYQISNYTSSIQFEIDEFNDIYNYRNFRKFINILEERHEKIDSIIDWVDKEIFFKKIEKKKKIYDLNNNYSKINYYNPSDFRYQFWEETYQLTIDLLYIVFYILTFINIFILITILICFFFFKNWEEILFNFFKNVIYFSYDLLLSIIKLIIVIVLLKIIIDFNTLYTHPDPQKFYDSLVFIDFPVFYNEHNKILHESLLIEHNLYYTKTPTFIWNQY